MEDHRGEKIVEADFTGAHLHGVDLTDVRITDAWIHGVSISGDVTQLTVNGIEVAGYVEAELDRLHPVRMLLRSEDPDDLRAAWSQLQARADETEATARHLPPDALDERVDGEWSYLQTLRHLVMATERWLIMPVLGDPTPHHPWGWPNDPHDEVPPGVFDLEARPSLDEVLELRRDRMAKVSSVLDDVDVDSLARSVPHPYGDAPNTVLHCVHVVLREEFWHDQYATRDLATLLQRQAGDQP